MGLFEASTMLEDALRERYEILSELGQGGFGNVYKARQLATGQTVAIKVLRLAELRGAASQEKLVARFRRETDLCAQMHHPNIVRLIDSGTTDQAAFYSVFEYVPGKHLGQVLASEGALSAREAKHLMIQVLDALACAHAAGVVHRDLKPANIMVIPTGARRNAVVLDFGIGTLVDEARGADHARITRTHEALGTPAYAAPEQLRGERPTQRSDLYAWGLVYLECLTGRRIIDGETVPAVLFKQLSPDPVPIPEAFLAHPLGRILRLVTAKDPLQRDATAKGLLEALEDMDMQALGGSGGRAGDRTMSFADTVTLVGGAESTILSSPDPLFRERLITGERRQLTALCASFSVVGPEGAAGDVEELDAILTAQQEACALIAKQNEGHFASALGDQALFYFGFPVSREGDALRAARAALAMEGAVREASAKLEKSRGIKVDLRVGVHTGLVVVRELDEKKAGVSGVRVVGMTPRIAARVGMLAPPGAAVVSAETRSILRGRFGLEPSGTHSLEPQGTPVEIFSLRELDEAGTTAAQEGRTPLVGRDRELDALAQHFRRAASGTGQAVLLTGEPGIGKSAILRGLDARIRGENTWLECRCSSETTNSAFFPVIELVLRLVDAGQEKGADERAAGLEALLNGHGFELGEAMPLFTALLGLPLPPRFQPLDVSAQKQRQMTIEAVLSLLFEVAKKEPLVLVVEDLQWADPSSLELLHQLVGEVSGARVLALFTARPELLPTWSTSAVQQMPLERLGRAEVERIAAHIAQGRGLPPEAVEEVARRTDGVPLFVEELLRSMLEGGALISRDGQFELSKTQMVSIPSTLRGSLIARLDRLGRAKETAQVAAAIGRELSVELLAAVSPYGEAAAQEDLDKLTAAELVYRKRRGKGSAYHFKHALIRDAAYDSMDKEARKQVHARIARVMEEMILESPHSAAALARHYAGAGAFESAVNRSILAAQLSIDRSSNAEATAQAAEVAEWLPELPEGARVDAQLRVNRIKLQALMSTEGWASPNVRALAEESRDLLARTGTTEHTTFILFCLYMHYHVASERAACRQVADELVTFAERIGDQSLECAAATAKGVHFHADGRFLDAETWLEKARGLYDPGRDKQQRSIFGMDWRVWASAQLAWVEWGMGRTARAFELAQGAIDWARSIKHVPSLGIALLYISQIHQMNGDKEAVRRSTGELLQASKTYGLPAFEGHGAALASWAAGDLKGVQTIIGILQSINCNLFLPYYGSFLADIEADAGNIPEAVAHVETWLEVCTRYGEHVFEPELLRRRAMLEMRLEEPNRVVVQALLLRARSLARENGMHRFEAAAINDELRALGDNEALTARLTQIYNSFPDLMRQPETKE